MPDSGRPSGLGHLGAGEARPGFTNCRRLTEGEPVNPWVEGCGFPSSLQLSSRADEGTLPALPACLDTAVAIPRVEKAQSLTFETRTQAPIFPVSWEGRPAPSISTASVWAGALLSLGWTLRHAVAGHLLNLHLPFKNWPSCFPERLHHFALCHRVGVFWLPRALAITCYGPSVSSPPSRWARVVPPGSFRVHTPP